MGKPHSVCFKGSGLTVVWFRAIALMLLTLNGECWYDFAGAEHFLLNIYRSLSLSPSFCLSWKHLHIWRHKHVRTHTPPFRCDQTCKQADISRMLSHPAPTHTTLFHRSNGDWKSPLPAESSSWEMDWGWIRRPVPSSPHFAPNRYKLGMKSLASCQQWSGTWCLFRTCSPIKERYTYTCVDLSFVLLCLIIVYMQSSTCCGKLCVRVAGWFLMRALIRPVGVNVFWSDLRESSFFFCQGTLGFWDRGKKRAAGFL